MSYNFEKIKYIKPLLRESFNANTARKMQYLQSSSPKVELMARHRLSHLNTKH
jgi:hypothetical protein